MHTSVSAILMMSYTSQSICVLCRVMNKIITAICDSGHRTFQKEIKEEDRQQWNALGSFVKEQVESHNLDV